MQFTLAAALILALSTLTSACSMSTQHVDTKKNPHPKMRYEVTLTIDKPPGPFDSITGYMQYEVTNKECVPVTGAPMNPLRLAPKAHPEIVFTRVAENVYATTVYADYFQDEDYFGLGVCHWSLMAVITSLNINKLSLSPSLDPEELFSQKSSITYFVRQVYLASDNSLPDFGQPSRDKYPPSRQKDIFSVTLSAKEHFQ